MQATLKKIAGLAATLAPGLALAHPGEHGFTGFAATLVHLLAEHGYLLPMLAAVGLFTWHRRQRS